MLPDSLESVTKWILTELKTILDLALALDVCFVTAIVQCLRITTFRDEQLNYVIRKTKFYPATFYRGVYIFSGYF